MLWRKFQMERTRKKSLGNKHTTFSSPWLGSGVRGGQKPDISPKWGHPRLRIYLPRTSGCPQGYWSARSLICGDRKVPGFESQFCSLCLTLAVQLKCLPSDCLSVLVCNSANQHQARRRQWHPTPVLLPGKSHGWRSLKGCSPWGRWRLDTTEWLHFHFLLSCIGEGNGNPLQCSCLENPRDGGAWWAAVYGVT